jgi:hypothetical protein
MELEKINLDIKVDFINLKSLNFLEIFFLLDCLILMLWYFNVWWLKVIGLVFNSTKRKKSIMIIFLG